tara:strand:- start:83 stop:286 length:204 start_codon:yes stop_codon:yes gene_type:complete
MPRRKKESKSNEKPFKPGTFVLGDNDATIVERGKKFAAYDKFGKLIILGYNRRIVEEYANDQRIFRS